MTLAPYRAVLRIPQLRQSLLLGVLLRTPVATSLLVLTLHVVTDLGLSYGRAGIVVMAATVALAISSPWRGRMVDRIGLRATLTPSLVVLAVVWSVAPFLSYWPLVIACLVGGLFQVPMSAVLRQMILAAVPVKQRRSALSLDAMSTEMAYMIGPAAGVVAATVFDTRYVLLTTMWVAIIGAVILWLIDPPLVSAESAEASLETSVTTSSDDEPSAFVSPREAPTAPSASLGRSRWVSPAAIAVLAVTAATTVVLGGTDVSVVALLRDHGQATGVAVAMAVWAAGSLIGGFTYGALDRSVPAHVLLAALAVVTLPVALAQGTAQAAALLFVAGLLCAPTLTATTEQLSALVPERARGEAMGWHGSAIMAGSALGAPLAGFAIDAYGPPFGFVITAVAALLAAVVATVLLAGRRRRRASISTPEPEAATVDA